MHRIEVLFLPHPVAVVVAAAGAALKSKGEIHYLASTQSPLAKDRR